MLHVTVVAVAVEDAVAVGLAAGVVAADADLGLAVTLGAVTVAVAACRVVLAVARGEGRLLAAILPAALVELSVLGWLTANVPPLTV